MKVEIRIAMAMLAATVALGTPGVARAGQASCEEFFVPVNLSQFPALPQDAEYRVYAELCRPKNAPWPGVVQLLTHGSTHDHNEWAFPFHPNRYSHVELAARAGYATLNIDRIGTGRSSKPPPALITVDLIASVLNQLAVKLRDGTIDDGVAYLDGAGPAGRDDAPGFAKVLYFGASLAVGYGWELEVQYPDAVDGYVLHGSFHDVPLAWIDLVVQHHVFPAFLDPVLDDPTLAWDPNGFSALSGGNTGMGYSTTEPGWHDDFFIHASGTHPGVIPVDESTKGAVSSYLVEESAQDHVIMSQPCDAPNPSESCSITSKPVILLVGDHDGATCGGPSLGALPIGGPPGPGVDCSTEANVIAAEQPFYRVPLAGNVKIVRDAGHNIHIHDGYKAVHDDWLVARLHALGF